MTRVVVLSDTHLRAGSRTRLPKAVYDHLDRADVILHAGDLVTEDLLRELEGFAPTHAVLGNNDAGLVGLLPVERVLDIAGVRFGMIHDSGPSVGREHRLRRRFPEVDIVVFGHSHAPVDMSVQGEWRMFNPGSPTQRRAQPAHTIGLLSLHDARVVAHRIVRV